MKKRYGNWVKIIHLEQFKNKMVESKFFAEKLKWSEKSKKQLDLLKFSTGDTQIREERGPLTQRVADNPLEPSKALRGGAVDQPFPRK